MIKEKIIKLMIKIYNLTLGLGILFLFYFLSNVIIKCTHISMPPAILGLIIFATLLINGILKEKWIEDICNFLINNMALFIVPFMGGLIVYKSILIKNWILILFVIFITTTLTIVLTGLFVEYGLKILRLHKMRKRND